jgi:hypothetical protein
MNGAVDVHLILRNITTAIAVVLLTTIASAQKLETSHNQDKTTDFKKITTYAWLPAPPPPKIVAPGSLTNPNITQEVLGPHIISAVDRELTSRGLKQAPEAQADVLVIYYAAVNVGFNATYLGEYYGYITGWGSPIAPGLAPSTSMSVYEEGTIIVDIVQRDPKKAVWRGTMKTRVNHENTPEKRVARINEAVSKVFQKYPVRKK